MKRYFVFLNNEQLGPLSIEQVKRLNIQANTLVRTEGMANWVAAGQLDELRQALLSPGTASAGGQRAAAAKKRSSDIVLPASSDPSPGNARKRLFFLVVLAAIAGYFVYTEKQKAAVPTPTEEIINSYDTGLKSEQQVENKPVPPKLSDKDNEMAHPMDFLQIRTAFHPNSSTKSIVSGLITNNATGTTYSNIVITVFYLDRSGTALETEEFVIRQTVKPAQTINFHFDANAPAATVKTDVTFNEAKAE